MRASKSVRRCTFGIMALVAPLLCARASTADLKLGHRHDAHAHSGKGWAHGEEGSLTDAVLWDSPLSADQLARGIAHLVRRSPI